MLSRLAPSRLIRPRKRIVPTALDMLEPEHPTLRDVQQEARRAYVQGDVERAQTLSQAARAMVLRAQARAREQ